ncbi:MAG TPA: hypothetical protein VFF29_04685 [Bacteroidota bacterium]|nr:hypothetical protein [Bacteroidota bacterium]
MNHHYLEEPYLMFGKDTHICPRKGIANYEVFDIKFKERRSEIILGAIGLAENIDQLHIWLEKCSGFIPAKKESKQPNLFPSFSGFNEASGFRSKIIYTDNLVRKINSTEMKRILAIPNRSERIEKAVEHYAEHIKFLSQNRQLDVIICVLPKAFDNKIVKEPKVTLEETLEEEMKFEINFRRALKAKAMEWHKPIQIIKEKSFSSIKGSQDDATKAWNFCTALYYKSILTVPWRLIKDENKPLTCYAGISFYRSRDKKSTQTSLAQVFDELGNGVILRGELVEVDKNDLKPHLSETQSYTLIKQALEEYRFALETFPARLVIHKSSNYNESELNGFTKAIDELRIASADFITIYDSTIKLFRDGLYPPLRGTLIELEEAEYLLYTRGSVEYYQTYPGMYIPSPIQIRMIRNDESPLTICKEILALTKMNWNNTQFDGKYPITISCARQVGEIMKYLTPEQKPQLRYAFYM